MKDYSKVKIKSKYELIEIIESSLDLFDKTQSNDVNYSIEVAKESLILSNTIDYKKGIMKSLHILGSSYLVKGKIEDSFNCLMESLEIANEIDNSKYKLKCFNSLGNTYFEIKNYELALEYYNKVLRMSKELNNKDYEAKALNNIGEIYNRLESYDEALKYYKECKVISEIIGDNIVKGTSVLNIGDIYYHFKDYENSEVYAKKGIQILEDANFKISQADGYQLLGKIYFKQNDNKKALEYFNKSLDLYDEISSKLYKIEVLIDIHKIYKKENEYEKAIDLLKEGLEISKELNEVGRISKICSLLAIIYENMDNYKEALTYYKIFHDIEKEEGVLRQEQKLNSVKIHMKMEQTNSEKEIFKQKNIELEHKNDELEESYRKIQIIREIGQKITAKLNLEEIINMIYDHINKLMDAHVFVLGLYDKDKEIISYKLCIKNGVKLKPYDKEFNTKYSFAARCIEKKDTILINDLHYNLGENYDTFVSNLVVKNKANEELPKSIIYCPLIVENHALGMITVQSNNENAYDKHNLDTLKALASYIAIAINNAKESEKLSLEIKDRKKIQLDLVKANEKLLKLAHIDPLTNILNRRRFIEVLNTQLNYCRRTSNYISLIMIDVDKFKEYNDNYGHLAGDSVLIKIANTIKDTLKRTTDYIARYGGDEFIVILPMTSCEGAISISEKIIKNIRSLKIEHKYTDVSDIVTLTLGVATMIPSKDNRVEELIHQADEALYIAKSKGRNRVESI